MQIGLHSHTYEEIVLELCEVFWNASFSYHSTDLLSKQ